MSIKIVNDTANGAVTLSPSNTTTGDITQTLPPFATELAPRMQLMTAQATTSGTSIDFTGIPSWAKKITVMFNGVSTSGTSFKLVQIGSTSIASTGYISASGSISGAAGYAVANATAGFIINSTDGADNLYGSMIINLVTGSTYGVYGTLGDTLGTYINSYTVSGGVTLSGALDRVRITTVNGTDTFDAGQINILYEG